MSHNVCLLSLTGSSYYIGAYANELSRSDNVDQVYVFVPGFSQEIEIIDSNRVKIREIDIEDSIAGSVQYTANMGNVLGLISDIENDNPDIIHIVNEMRVPFYFPYILKSKTELPIILTVHEPNPKVPSVERRLFLNPLQKLNLMLMAPSIDRFVVHGRQLKQELINLGPSSDCVDIIPHGSFSKFFGTGSQKALQEPKTVLFFGRADPGKGLPHLIEAAEHLKNELPQLRVILARYNSDRYGELDSEIFETYEQRLEESKVSEVFQRASVVILPYTDASISGIISIASGFSTPVIVTDAGSLSELVDHGYTGLVVPPGDSKALSEAMKKLLTNESLRSRMGKRLYHVQNEIYSWERVVSETTLTYKKSIS